MKMKLSVLSAVLLTVACLQARGQSNTAPNLLASSTFQSRAVNLGASTTLSIAVTGDAPLWFQWRFDGQDLPGQTQKSLFLSNLAAANEGDYSVVVTNLSGSITSGVARVFVVPPVQELVKSNLTALGSRLPYFFSLPTNYSAVRTYPLVCMIHGGGGDEISFTQGLPGWPGYGKIPPFKVFASYRQQTTDPAIVVWPTRRAGDDNWTFQYLQQVTNLLQTMISGFSIDTNRIYIVGFSDGFDAAWDVLGYLPNRFAGALLIAGEQGVPSAASISHVPSWEFCAADDEYGSQLSTRLAVRALRCAGASARYTEYHSGGHLNSMTTALSTVPVVNWLLAQRLGAAPAVGPLVAINKYPPGDLVATGSGTIDLSGTSSAPDQSVSGVVWTNAANNTTGSALGNENWVARGIPLQPDRTNTVVVVATTGSWAPGIGGTTTFNSTLEIISTPIRAALRKEGGVLTLSWTGGVPPFQVQQADEVAAEDWNDLDTDATSPFTVVPSRASGFFRVLGN
jgi:poly(3-hydroxybutyrate) depolymerase